MLYITADANSEVMFSLPGFDAGGNTASGEGLAVGFPPRIRRAGLFGWPTHAVCSLSCERSPWPQLTTTITSLPAVGTLYQLSQVYSDYGYEPKRGVPFTGPANVTGSKQRLLYVPPPFTNAPDGMVSPSLPPCLHYPVDKCFV